MATTGELIWASLIASWKARQNAEGAGVWVRLRFEFGPHLVYETPRVPVREFRLINYEWPVHTRVPPIVLITFTLRAATGFSTEEYIFPVVWNYRWTGEKSPYTCNFPYREWGVFFWLTARGTGGFGDQRRIFLSNLHHLDSESGVKNSPGPGFKAFGPRLILNGIRSGSLLPSGLIAPARVIKVPRGPYARKAKVARLNPEITTRVSTAAQEIYPSTPYYTYVENLQEFRRDWTGTVTPGFGNKRGSQLPVNPHTVTLHKTKYTLGYDLRRKFANPNTTYNNSWLSTQYSMTAPSMGLTETQFTQVGNAALAKLAAKANVALSGNIALNILEARQLGRLIGDTAMRMTRSLKYLKQGRLSAAAKVLLDGKASVVKFGPPLSLLNSVAKNWLSLQYGWKPLLNDVNGAMVSYANFMANNTSSSTVRASKRLVRESRTGILGPTGVQPFIGFENNNSKWQCRYGAEFSVSDPLKSFLAQTGFTTPVNLAWEIIPFSFVFDWFLPIGPYLEAFSQPHGLKFIRGYKTLFGRRETIIDVHWHGAMPGDATAELRTYAHRHRTTIALGRTALASWPSPVFPVFKSPVSMVHALNALALLQVLRRR